MQDEPKIPPEYAEIYQQYGDPIPVTEAQHKLEVQRAKFRNWDRESRMVVPLVEDLLSNIEEDARQYYDLTHDMENTLSLSQAVSLMRSAGGQPPTEFPVDNPFVAEVETQPDSVLDSGGRIRSVPKKK